MRKFIFLLIPWFIFAGVKSYKIDVELKVKGKWAVYVAGSETIVWENNSTVPVQTLQFHLYQNAFREGSSFMKEIGGLPGKWKKHREWWGSEEIKKITVNGNDLTPNLHYSSPDDGNKEDKTVAELALDEPVQPGESLNIMVEFETKLPKAFARSGVGEGYFMVSQWFPKLGVLEEDGKWVCHQYHRNGEFYSDFSTYDVNITLPSEYKVAATGELVERKKRATHQILEYHMEKIHDFAWVADRDFVILEDSYKSEIQPKIKILLYLQPDHRRQAGRYFESIKRALKFFTEKVGPYPYHQISIIDPDNSALRTSGMEYPTLITTGTFYLLPRGIRMQEMVTIHEFGHQYWYGVVANNETDEAWLDEGVNTFFEMNIMGTYPWMFDFLGFRSKDSGRMRVSYSKTTYADPIITPSWKFFPGTYSASVYTKTALILETWKRLVGKDRFFKALSDYFKKYSFKHPHSMDFFKTIEESLGEDWSGLWKPLFYQPGKVDWKVYSVRKKRLILLREGVDVRIPVDVKVKLIDGKEVNLKWSSKWLKKDFPVKIKEVRIDPEEKLMIDADPFNNWWSQDSPLARNLLLVFLEKMQIVFLNLLP